MMSTIVNNPPPTERTVIESDSSGWAVAVIVLLAVIGVGTYFFLHYKQPSPAAQPPVIQVNLPTGNTGQPAPAK